MTAALLAALVAAAPQSVSAESLVTLPLQQLLPLLDNKVEAKAKPPMGAVVTGAQLKGRVLGEALVVDAHLEVSVLADNEWVSVPLLPVGPDVVVTSAPRSDRATIAAIDGVLTLLSNRSGTAAVDVGLSIPAQRKGTLREASFTLAKGNPQTPLHLEVDPAFQLVHPSMADGNVEVAPRGNRWTVAWRVRGTSSATRKPAARPPLEPTIPRATATWVTTLEGKLELRVRYGLRFDREHVVEIEIPEGQRLERIALNGRPVAAEPAGRTVAFSVAPSDVGSTESSLEVVTAQDLGVFHLSGALRLSLPRISWPVGEVVARAHLPAVFEYRREGGSLEARGNEERDDEPDGALPGRKLSFRQQRVSASAPSVELSYSVDIDKSYFR